MRETIVIQLGNRGANIGSSFWRQISAEHWLENHSFTQKESINQKDNNWAAFFHEQNENKIIPRSVIIDAGSNNNLTDTPFLQYSDYDDPEKNYVLFNNRDNGKLREEELSQIESAIRKQIERCDSLTQCMFIRDSTEAISIIVHDIELENIGLGRKYIHDIVVLADRSSNDEQIINSTLSLDLFAQEYPSRIIYQDSAIQRQVHSNNQHSKVDLNRFVAKTLSSFTAADRFSNENGIYLSQISHSDAYPGISFTVPSYVTDEIGMPCEVDPSTQSLIGNALQNSSLLCDVDFNAGYYMRIHMFTRGLLRDEISQSVQRLQEAEKIRLVSWVPTGIKVGFDDHNYRNSKLFHLDERSVCAALHNTAIKSIFQLWQSNINQLKTQNTLQQLLERNNVAEVEFNEAFDELNNRILGLTQIEREEII